ncbi:Transcription factor pur-alpha [Thalictrum thalictroides]|uniref:Transcription factor pur-alpha n=1 Tax=Thalictrum thalictroides TaxID=46969 RepID=A0A7J6VXL6_THATH|nr:Transcription factor pur-alpha [Thalictrum thalictroides]
MEGGKSTVQCGGRLMVSEASVSRNRSTIIVPAGSAQDEGLAAFRNILAEMKHQDSLYCPISNNRGHFLRISEVAGADRCSIILPLSGLRQFHEMVGHFVDITKDRFEGMTGANVRTVVPPQR